MQALRRAAVSTARRGRTSVNCQGRRYAHDEHAHGHAHASVNEAFGPGFWGVVALFPIGYAVYAASRQGPDSPTFFTQFISKFTEKQDELAAYNDVHVRMMEQAGSDRVLFMNSKSQDHVPVKFPELLTVSSPYNVPAGHQVNLDETLAKFKREANEDNERKLEALRNNTIKSEQPLAK
ncbi:hypothetical protein BU24DRAFT_455011 [Aaosphaeria arxii CBS 175.79]|uniref:NADH-ubiquinone oxidoreductase 17.8 kDa subunit n=1 Tax=Aaosphaeria arxii CBS 175.79 TaxID=1450172 RepID=A0A6A5XAA9_9PLEO|nr:uncharacterized protein BU24DRAFT_455011 [Aaosphaeria arxii CBS 175.79]KAF2009796.1 hypothetical protein BU24DRAFT_455011 [Aaosphaeria arxii CBS 175.79]